MWLDSEMKLEKQLEDTCNKADNKVTLLQHIRWSLDRETAISVYKTVMLPLLEYCDFLVDSGPKDSIKSEQWPEAWWNLSINKLHLKFKVKRLVDRRKHHLVCLIYRYAENPDNRVLQNNRTRPDKKVKLRLDRPMSELYRKSPLYWGFQIWNKLPTETQMSDSIHHLK